MPFFLVNPLVYCFSFGHSVKELPAKNIGTLWKLLFNTFADGFSPLTFKRKKKFWIHHRIQWHFLHLVEYLDTSICLILKKQKSKSCFASLTIEVDIHPSTMFPGLRGMEEEWLSFTETVCSLRQQKCSLSGPLNALNDFWLSKLLPSI